MGGDPAPVTIAASRNDTLPSGVVRWEGDLDTTPATLDAGVGDVERLRLRSSSAITWQRA
jgi:hypothetical protein